MVVTNTAGFETLQDEVKSCRDKPMEDLGDEASALKGGGRGGHGLVD